MTFPTGFDFRNYSDEELTTMLAEAGEASKHARKLGRVMGVVAAHRIKDVKEFLTYQQLATWRRENGFDRVEAVEKNWFDDHRSLPPTPEQYHAGLWVEVNALKAAISMPIRGGPSWQEYKRNIIRKIEQGEVSDEDFAVIKQPVEKRVRETAQVTAVTRDHTVQHCRPCSPNPDRPSGVHCNLENNEDEMDPGMEELTSSSASTGLNTPGQESPPNEGVWETGRTTADSFLTAGVGSSKERNIATSTTTTVAGISSTAATPPKRRHKTSSEENKQFDPGGRGEQAPPWKAAVPPPFFSGGEAGRLLARFLCPVCVFSRTYIFPFTGETYQQAERRGSWTPIKSLMYATGGQALSRLLPYLKMAMTSNARFDRSANALR